MSATALNRTERTEDASRLRAYLYETIKWVETAYPVPSAGRLRAARLRLLVTSLSDKELLEVLEGQ